MSKLNEAHRRTQPVRLPATRSELEMRLKQRPTPAVVRHVTPDGIETSTVNGQVNRQAERRIAQLRNSLSEAKDRLRAGTRYADQHGRAKGDFERIR